MSFRWVVIIALWTCLSGPIFAPPSQATSRPYRPAIEKPTRAPLTAIPAQEQQ